MEQVKGHDARKDPSDKCRSRRKRKATADARKNQVKNDNPAKKDRQTSDCCTDLKKKLKGKQQKTKEKQFCRDHHYRGFCAFGPLCRYSHTTMDLTAEVDWYAMFSHDKSDMTDKEDAYQSYFFLRSETIPLPHRRLPIFQTFCAKTTDEEAF